MSLESIVVLAEDFDLSPQEVTNKLAAQLSGQLNNGWSGAAVPNILDAFRYGDKRIPLSGNAMEEHEKANVSMTAWSKRGPGWVRDIWLEFSIRNLLDGDLKEELGKAKRHIGILKRANDQYKEKIAERMDLSEIEKLQDELRLAIEEKTKLDIRSQSFKADLERSKKTLAQNEREIGNLRSKVDGQKARIKELEAKTDAGVAEVEQKRKVEQLEEDLANERETSARLAKRIEQLESHPSVTERPEGVPPFEDMMKGMKIEMTGEPQIRKLEGHIQRLEVFCAVLGVPDRVLAMIHGAETETD